MPRSRIGLPSAVCAGRSPLYAREPRRTRLERIALFAVMRGRVGIPPADDKAQEVLIMMMFASPDMVPNLLPLAIPSGLIGLMLVVLAISGLALAGAAASGLRLRREPRQPASRVRPILGAPRHAAA